jgi:alpha-L-fucosidase
VDGVYGSTHRGRRVYLFVLRWPESGALRVPSLPGRTVVSCRTMSGVAGACAADTDGLAVTVPVSARTSPVTVVALELDGAAVR